MRLFIVTSAVEDSSHCSATPLRALKRPAAQRGSCHAKRTTYKFKRDQWGSKGASTTV